MSSLTFRRNVAANERVHRLSQNFSWLLVRLICLAILAGGWNASCWAEDRPVVENSIGMKLVSIPAGEFLMGATEEEITLHEKIRKRQLNDEKMSEAYRKQIEEELDILPSTGPQHRVVITKPFCLGVYSVTQQEFTKIMGFNPSRFSATGWFKDRVKGIDTSRFPVERVSWEEAVEFCRQLSALPEEVAAGRTYRLPTEAEWEYACRAGTTTQWYWGKREEDAPDYAWCMFGLGKKTDAEMKKIKAESRTHPVGEKKPNPWGLFDMIGNVTQWCADWYDSKAYATAPLHDPTGPSSGTERTVRGSVFSAGRSFQFKSWKRAKQVTTAAQQAGCMGFRVACDVSTPPPPVETKPETSSMKEAEARLKEKGLSRRMGYFLLPEEASFIRYCSTIERLRVACFHAQKECQDAQRQLSRVQSAKASTIQSRMQARSAIGYSDTWREHWAATRARNQASDAAMLVDLSKEGVQKWQQDAQTDLDSAVELFAGQIDKLHKMYQKLQKDYAKLYEDETVKHALGEMNSQGKTTYRIGPTPSAAAAMKKLEHEQGLLAQFKKS